LLSRRPPTSPLFPYTTLFRSTTVPRFVQAFLGGMPTALFLLMPVFALLLKLAWTGSGLAYLEHLVVALYSHCWLMLVLLASFALDRKSTRLNSSHVKISYAVF